MAVALAGCVAVGLAPRSQDDGPPAPKRPCKAAEIPESLVKAGEAYTLNIPDRAQHPSRPKEGWCGCSW